MLTSPRELLKLLSELGFEMLFNWSVNNSFEEFSSLACCVVVAGIEVFVHLIFSCGMNLRSYLDKDLVQNFARVVQGAIEHEHQLSESSLLEAENSSFPHEVTMTREEVLSIQEDLSVIKLQKTATCSTGKTYILSGKKLGKTAATRDSGNKSSTTSETKRVFNFPFCSI